MSARYLSSVTHKSLLDSGLSVVSHIERGSGDDGFSVVAYSDGQVWIFDNCSAHQCDRSSDYSVDDLVFVQSGKVVEQDGYNLHEYFDAVIPWIFTRAWIAQHYIGDDSYGVGVSLLEDVK